MLKKITLIGLSFVCLFVFGGWSSVTQQPTRYADAAIVATRSLEQIYYTTKSVDENYTPYSCPMYARISGLENSCGAVAGAIIVGYYDKYYPNMIEGWDSYYANGRYRLQNSTYVNPLINELYTLMRTNVDDVGVSEEDFVNGLEEYVEGQGYNITMQDLVSGSSIDYSACKTAINNNKVIALLSDPGNIYDIGSFDSYDGVSSYNVTSGHIMVACGYREISYYNASGTMFRNDKYLYISTGMNTLSWAWYKINPHNLNAAYVVSIS